MQKERYHEIDVLRGLAMLAIIIIHAAANFSSDKTAVFFWNSLQFAVPVFLFCSAYISFKRDRYVTLAQFPIYIFKRLKRLLIPYWIFLVAYIPLVYFYEPSQMSPKQMLRFATLTTGGNDMSWLVLLFMMAAFLVPLIIFFNKKHAVFFWILGAASFVSSIFLLVFKTPLHFKLVMWIPWTLIFYFTWYFVRNEYEKGKLLEIFITSTIAYVFLCFYLPLNGHSIVHYENKYPPNLFHLSYGISSTLLLYYLAKKKLFDLPYLKQGVSFLSRHSYPIYFIHFLILYVMTTYYKNVFMRLTWWSFFLVLLGGTVCAELTRTALVRLVGRAR